MIDGRSLFLCSVGSISLATGLFLIVLFNMCYCEAAVSSGQRASFCSFYYLLLREEVQGVPFFPNEFWPVNGVGNSVSPPWAEAIVSANGFEYIEISGIWEPISIVERGFAMSLDQACDNYATFHGSLLGEESFTVNRIVFAYVPMLMDNEHFFEKIEYRPAFIFHRSDRGMAEAFDAISGELLSWME